MTITLKRPYLVAIIAGTLIAVAALTSSAVFAQGPPQGNPNAPTEMAVIRCAINGQIIGLPIAVIGHSLSSGVTVRWEHPVVRAAELHAQVDTVAHPLAQGLERIRLVVR